MQKITHLIRLITAALMGVAAGIDVALKVRALHAGPPPHQSGGADEPGLQERVLTNIASRDPAERPWPFYPGEPRPDGDD